ncbi:MAG: hypothetical protein A2731_04245 [Candidatus Buchananbacteria bacterium RIFCSPHIGHO2_01_FULL_39_8]|uniref:Uncharacterized protein n=1 Tax=Candidatus Buchananbacteria bacterium RIFCSPHIGHO2_01_FULL_39_8 TaxID=1797533 RepID=A0A1G1Y286_9BACT|nr:MAG: hypothetical protein A2731_04245 [Candidatus Buchananbacteria bacterium RIFCSPHIGHO2_01_FULL_39_8]
MDYFAAKINQLVIDNQRVKKSFIRSFISKTSVQLGKNRGRLFGLIEINSTEQKVSDLTNLIIEEVKDNYYSAEKNADDDSGVEGLFETALQKTNLAIAAFLENERIILDLEKVNITIGVIANRELYFTQVGNINIFLFQHLTRKEFRIIDILEVTKTPIAAPNPLKMFSQVIAGRIGPRNVLFLATNNLLDYFSLEKIKNIIINNQTITDGIDELKELIKNLNVENNFGVIVSEIERVSISPVIEPRIQKFDYQKAASQDSIRELIRTEKETEKLLTPSILPEIKKYTKVFRQAFQTYLIKIKNTSLPKSKRISIPKIPKLPRLNIKSRIGRNIKTIQTFSSPIKRRVENINLSKLSSSWQRISYPIRLGIKKIWSSFSRLPVSSRIFLIISIILGILFLQSIVWLGIKNQREKIVEEFNQAILNAESKKNEAEASLIYRDENQARRLLLAAKNTILALDPKSKEQEEKIQSLGNEIESSLEKLRHTVNIDEPVLVANFQNLDAQAKIAKLAVLTNNTLYTQNYRNQSIYKANLTSRIISGVYSETVSTGNFNAGIKVNDNELIFINEARKAFLLNPRDDSIQEINFDLTQPADITNVSIYNNRLYILDKNNNQIYRYSKVVGGYGNIQEWVNDNTIDLSNSVSLVVDGLVYVLKNNGEIIKLEQGKKTDFEITTVDPIIQSPTKIKTNTDSSYLYVLDPPSGRLIVLDKDGKLINQYTSKKFDDLKDFVVDEVEKKIYLLNGSSIFGIPASHLE